MMQTQAVLGLSINARMQGLAIISGNRLVEYHIQSRKQAWTPNKKELIVASLQPWFDCYSIKNVALSIPYENQISTQTKEFLESLKRYFKKNNIAYCVYPPKTIHAYYEGTKTKSKKEMMRMIALQHPELSRYYQKEI